MQPRRELSVFDSVSIIVGIIIGAGIYETAPTVAGCLGSPAAVLAFWGLGGLLALSGALCYAELATAHPRAGGDYVYLTRAFGRLPGFLFGWSQLAIVRPGDIALMAFIFARYASQLWAPLPGQGGLILWAALAVVVLTGVNILGVTAGRRTQNVLTVAKVLGMLLVIAAAFAAPHPAVPAAPAAAPANVKLALILILFTYGGWNEMAYVAAEVKNPERNIVRALVQGTLAVVALYALINAAFLHALGFEGLAKSQAVGVQAISASFSESAAGRLIAALICISAAGAVNGLIFTGARISYALGADHALLRPLGRWNERRGVPVASLLTQGALSLAIVIFAGSFIDTIVYTAPVVWLFFLGAALSLFVLRRKEPVAARPYRVHGFPLTPLLFAGACLFMLYSSATYAWSMKPWGLALMSAVFLAGVPLYALSRRLETRAPAPTPTLAPEPEG